MPNDLESLYDEAYAFIMKKDYISAKELLEVLVSSDYKPAYKMLLVLYRQLNEKDLEHELKEKMKENGINFETNQNQTGDVFLHPTRTEKTNPSSYSNNQFANSNPQNNIYESQKLWDWGEIIFLLTIILSLGILTPIAFLYRRIFRGFSILVENAEKNLNK